MQEQTSNKNITLLEMMIRNLYECVHIEAFDEKMKLIDVTFYKYSI